MGRKKPCWVEKPELAWTPEQPLRFEPSASTDFSSTPDSARPNALARPANLPFLPWVWSHNYTLNILLLLCRLGLALMQAAAFAFLLHGRKHHWWADTQIASGLAMMGALSPALLMQGLGRIAARPLFIWTACASLSLFGLGVYQHWRVAGSDPGLSALWLAAMAGVILFIGQSLLLARAKCSPAHYRALHRASWSLAVQLLLCGICAAALWAVWHALSVTGFTALLLMVLAAVLVTQFLDGAVLRMISAGLAQALTATLPVLALLSVGLILFWSWTRWLPPLMLPVLLGLFMAIGINASYRNGDWRPWWRRHLEFAGALLLPALVTLSAMALQVRVAAYGFTGVRVMALALVLLLAGYALAYAGAALISLGGGRAMERMETANLAMAFVVAGVLAAMASPLADPVRLAVAEQSWRLTHGVVKPAKFDTTWLSKSGLRFGHEALRRLAAPSLESFGAP